MQTPSYENHKFPRCLNDLENDGRHDSHRVRVRYLIWESFCSVLAILIIGGTFQGPGHYLGTIPNRGVVSLVHLNPCVSASLDNLARPFTQHHLRLPTSLAKQRTHVRAIYEGPP